MSVSLANIRIVLREHVVFENRIPGFGANRGSLRHLQVGMFGGCFRPRGTGLSVEETAKPYKHRARGRCLVESRTLAECRHDLGLTQEDVAKRLGISRARYAQIEHDPSNITVRQANAIAEVLGRSYQDIVFSKFVSPTNADK